MAAHASECSKCGRATHVRSFGDLKESGHNTLTGRRGNPAPAGQNPHTEAPAATPGRRPRTTLHGHLAALSLVVGPCRVCGSSPAPPPLAVALGGQRRLAAAIRTPDCWSWLVGCFWSRCVCVFPYSAHRAAAFSSILTCRLTRPRAVPGSWITCRSPNSERATCAPKYQTPAFANSGWSKVRSIHN